MAFMKFMLTVSLNKSIGIARIVASGEVAVAEPIYGLSSNSYSNPKISF
jgi:hypothetical protein